MSDRPIIFSAPMVRALLEGRKTQTRRVLKPQPTGYHDMQWPPYAPGDRLWVREAWANDAEAAWEPEKRGTFYRADPGSEQGRLDNLACGIPHEWKSPRFMHRWRSRLTLTVTDVRVQRVQEISVDDVVAEGIDLDDEHAEAFGSAEMARAAGLSIGCSEPEIYPFKALWDSINAKRGFGWDANPWVAAYTFTVQNKGIDA